MFDVKGINSKDHTRCKLTIRAIKYEVCTACAHRHGMCNVNHCGIKDKAATHVIRAFTEYAPVASLNGIKGYFVPQEWLKL